MIDRNRSEREREQFPTGKRRFRDFVITPPNSIVAAPKPAEVRESVEEFMQRGGIVQVLTA